MIVKTIHIATVVISLCLFIGRGVWVYALKNQLSARWIKVLPHINDTVLLVSGITLAIQLQQYPLVHHWLTVKIGCLFIYIGLGFMAMKYYKATRFGLICWVVAISVFVYMVTVAVNKNPAGIFVS